MPTDQTLSRPAEILQQLIQCQSVTPNEGGALSLLESIGKPLGFETQRVIFSDNNTPDVDNLYMRIGNSGPHLMFAGHTDVVPAGKTEDWQHPPFSGAIENGVLFGRGAVDMKGGIACFLAAYEAFQKMHGKPAGSVSFLITGDEEGPSINGTDKLLSWAAQKGEKWDACIVGEPSNQSQIGDTIKNGRRGSFSGKVTVHGVQGHSAYPHLADNPVRGMIDILDALLATPFDGGTDQFQPTNLEVTSIDVGNPATNVIAGEAAAGFNIRFNDTWDGETLKQEIIRRFETGANANRIRQGKTEPVKYSVEWIGRVSPVFLTKDERLISSLSSAINIITGNSPELSTGGGTSDARFIKDYCPVVEFGLVGQTMHKVDERTPVADLDMLSSVYLAFMENYFGTSA